MSQNFTRDEFSRHLRYVRTSAHVSVNCRRHHGHYLDALIGKVSTQRLAKRQERGLRRTVSAHNGQVHLGEGCGYIHNHPFTTLNHRRRQGARHSQCAEVIHVHFPHGVFKIHLQRIAVTSDAGVVHENINETEPCGSLHIIVVGDIKFDWNDRPAVFGCIGL